MKWCLSLDFPILCCWGFVTVSVLVGNPWLSQTLCWCIVHKETGVEKVVCWHKPFLGAMVGSDAYNGNWKCNSYWSMARHCRTLPSFGEGDHEWVIPRLLWHTQGHKIHEVVLTWAHNPHRLAQYWVRTNTPTSMDFLLLRGTFCSRLLQPAIGDAS